MKIVSETEWSSWLSKQTKKHILQNTAWGQLKNNFNWKPIRCINETQTAGAQILFRKLPLGLTFAYIPKGPVGNLDSEFWKSVDFICKRQKAMFLKVEPDLYNEDDKSPFSDDFRFVPGLSIQPRRTIVVSLQGPVNEWLGRMKQKTRYNIRLAEKKGIEIRKTADIDTFYEILLSTGNRDNFGIHSKEYYRKVFDCFQPGGNIALFLAYYKEQPLAGVIVFSSGKRAWYFYGASNEHERNRMPTYLLQFEAMKWASQQGCNEYDLWGIPDFNEDYLEENFSKLSEGLWGVYRFKRGFGGQIKRYMGAFDRVYNPFLYSLYKTYSKMRGSP